MGLTLANGIVPQEVVVLTLGYATVAEAVLASCCSSAALSARLSVRPSVALLLGNDDEHGDAETCFGHKRADVTLLPREFAAQAFSKSLTAEVLVPLSMLKQVPHSSLFRGLLPLRGLGELRVEGVLAPPGCLGAIAPHCRGLRALTVIVADRADAEELVRLCGRLREDSQGELCSLAVLFHPEYLRHAAHRDSPGALQLATIQRLPSTVKALYLNVTWVRHDAWCSVQLPSHVHYFGSVAILPHRWNVFARHLQPQPHVRVLAIVLVNPIMPVWSRHVKAAEFARVLREKFPGLEAVEFCLQYAVDAGCDERRLSRPWMLAFLRRLRQSLAQDEQRPGTHCAARMYSVQLNGRTLGIRAPLVRELCRLGFEAPAVASEWDLAPPASFRRGSEKTQ